MAIPTNEEIRAAFQATRTAFPLLTKAFELVEALDADAASSPHDRHNAHEAWVAANKRFMSAMKVYADLVTRRDQGLLDGKGE